MPVSITNKLYNFVNGTANDAAPVDAEVTNLHTNDANLAVYANAAALGNIKEGLALTLRSDFTGTPITSDNGLFGVERGTLANVYLRWNEEFDRWESTQDGTNYLIFASTLSADPSSPVNGSTWYNSGSNELKARINGVTTTIVTTAAGSSLPRNYQGSARPAYASASTFNVASIVCRNSDNDGDIIKTTSTTVDISTTGLNGVGQSANLTGTISVSAGNNTVTGSSTTFTSDFVVGDVIRTNGGQTRRVASIGSNTSMTVESNWSSGETTVAYRRGGEAINTWYYLYATTDGTTPGLMLSTRNVAGGNTLVDLPSGYTKSRQFPFAVRNDASGNILAFDVDSRWAFAYREATDATPYQVLSGGAATSFTAVDCSTVIPPISRRGAFNGKMTRTSDTQNILLRPTGASGSGWILGICGISGGTLFNTFEIALNASQQFDYRAAASGQTLDATVLGWYPTEVI